jgi:hypothetical protein
LGNTNHAIAHLGIDLVLIDSARNPKASPKRTDKVFTLDWLQAFVLAEIDRAFHSEHTVFDANVDVVTVHPRHL